MDMIYDFYIKDNMHAIEGKLNAMIHKNKSLINKFNESWRHPLNRKIRNNRVQMIITSEFFYYNPSINSIYDIIKTISEEHNEKYGYKDF